MAPECDCQHVDLTAGQGREGNTGPPSNPSLMSANSEPSQSDAYVKHRHTHIPSTEERLLLTRSVSLLSPSNPQPGLGSKTLTGLNGHVYLIHRPLATGTATSSSYWQEDLTDAPCARSARQRGRTGDDGPR